MYIKFVIYLNLYIQGSIDKQLEAYRRTVVIGADDEWTDHWWRQYMMSPV